MSNRISVFVILVILLHSILEANCQLPVYSPDNQGVAVALSPFGFELSNTTVFKFNVKACADAHVIIQQAATPDLHSAQNYVFVIGSHSNSKVDIKTALHGLYVASSSATVLSCTDFKALWISWTNGVLKLGRGTVEYADQLLSANVGTLSGYKYGFLLTGWGSYGCWNVDIGPAPVFYRLQQNYADKKLQASGLLSIKVISKVECVIRCTQSEQCACQKFSYNHVTRKCLNVPSSSASTLINDQGLVAVFLSVYL